MTQFDLSKAFQVGNQMNQAANYYGDRQRLQKQQQRTNALQDYSMGLKKQAVDQKSQDAARKDLGLIIGNMKTDDPNFEVNIGKAVNWYKGRNPHEADEVSQFEQMPTEEKKQYIGNLRSQMGLDKPKPSEQLTIYGPDGATKRVPVEKGKEFIPEEGWSLAKPAIPKGGAGARPHIAKLMADGWLPSGRITGPMLDAFEAAAEKAEELGQPLTIDKLRKMDFEATKNRRTGATAGGRLTRARAQNIESGMELLQEMKVTANNLDFSNIKLKGKFEAWKKGQLNDPVLAEYMTQRADSLFIITSAMKMNGVTDKAIEIEEEAFPVESSPRVFNAWFRTQMRGLARTGRLMNRDYGYGIKLPDEYTEGHQGQPKEKQKYTEGQTANGGKLIFSGGVWKDNI